MKIPLQTSTAWGHLKTLERAIKTVESWPTWKREVTLFKEERSNPMSERWGIEVGPVPCCGFEDGEYVDVSYSISDGKDTFRVQQRVANTHEGYTKAYSRIQRIIGAEPGAVEDERGGVMSQQNEIDC